jgi:hypothetical protein
VLETLEIGVGRVLGVLGIVHGQRALWLG